MTAVSIPKSSYIFKSFSKPILDSLKFSKSSLVIIASSALITSISSMSSNVIILVSFSVVFEKGSAGLK